MERIRTLFRAETKHREAFLTLQLHLEYDGDLFFPGPPRGRPYVVANFVTTLDGVVSFNIPGQSGGASISGSNEEDRFIMGLLRASADAVMVAAGTVEAVGRESLWTAEFAYPPARDLYRNYRLKVLKKSENPLVVIISGRGNVDLHRAIFHAPPTNVLVITTERGRERLALQGADQLVSTKVHVVESASEYIEPVAILEVLQRGYHVSLLLHEGGPSLLGSFVSSDCLDDLFLTLAPQIAGRIAERTRPSLVEGVAFAPAVAPWLSLLSVKQAGDHLYLHYRRHGRNEQPG